MNSGSDSSSRSEVYLIGVMASSFSACYRHRERWRHLTIRATSLDLDSDHDVRHAQVPDLGLKARHPSEQYDHG